MVSIPVYRLIFNGYVGRCLRLLNMQVQAICQVGQLGFREEQDGRQGTSGQLYEIM
jgi:hypothetical protein